MFDYTGFECKACGKEFKDDDDIVVCPDCGTPYHRDCYKKAGTCINTELHTSGISWKAANEKPAEETTKCTICGNQLRNDQLFCDKCGHFTEYYTKVNGADISKVHEHYNNTDQNKSRATDSAMETIYPFLINYSDPLCGFNPDEEYENGLTTKDIGDFVSTNTHYYLPKFRNMKHLRLKISLNFPAMIFPELFFANRKMPLAALLILIFKAIIGIPQTVVSLQEVFRDEAYRNMYLQMFPYISSFIEKITHADLNSGNFNMLFNVSYILEIATIFIFAGFSNYLYYRHVLSAADIVKKNSVSVNKNISFELKKAGGTSSAMLVTFIILYFIVQFLSIGLIMYLY